MKITASDGSLVSLPAELELCCTCDSDLNATKDDLPKSKTHVKFNG